MSRRSRSGAQHRAEAGPWPWTGRYYWGQFLNQVGRPDLAFKLWEQTLAQSAPDAPWAVAIREQIGNIAFRAGVEYEPEEPAPTLSGPSAEDMQAASEMTAEERQEMIRGMVAGLSDRLATEGGSPEEWARLIGALGVLGETERAQAILEEARQDMQRTRKRSNWLTRRRNAQD